MPPVLDALQAIFPDITSPVASVIDEPAVVAGGTKQGNLQSVEDGNKSYTSRMSAINSKVSAHKLLAHIDRGFVDLPYTILCLSMPDKLLCSTQLLWTTSVISSSTFCLNKSRLKRQMKMRLYKQTLVGSYLPCHHLVQNTGHSSYFDTKSALQSILLAGGRLACPSKALIWSWTLYKCSKQVFLLTLRVLHQFVSVLLPITQV